MDEAISLGVFELRKPIGRGGMARVWSGVHLQTDTPVAIKVLWSETAMNAAFRESFHNEVRAVAGLSHPNIIRVYDYGQVPASVESATHGMLEEGAPYIVMECARHGVLSRRLGQLQWPLVRDILLSLLSALAHAHARGIVHRDLKPSNVLLGGPHHPLKLVDFGLAQAVARVSGQSSGSLHGGTPGYSSPEQFRGDWRSTGPWTDMYSLGCLGWSIITGRPPFGRKRWAEAMAFHLHRQPPDLKPAIPIPRGVEEWLRVLLSKQPGERFLRAADAAWALRQLPESAGTTVARRRDLAEVHEEDTAPAPPAPADEEVTETTAPLAPASAGSFTPKGADSPLATYTYPKERLPPFPAEPEAVDRGFEALAGVGIELIRMRTIPMVGREAERASLWWGLRRVVRERSPRMMVLKGTAGAGKTRLASWLCERAHEAGVATPLRALHGATGGPQDGLGPMIARHLQWDGVEREEILARAQGWYEPHAEVRPEEPLELAELVRPSAGMRADGSGLRVTFGSSTERHLALLSWIRRVASERPVILWLEDVQWGLDSLKFAGRLLEATDGLPVLVLATAQSEALSERSTEAEALGRLRAHDTCEDVPVDPLPAREHRVLVRRWLGLAGELASKVETRTQGNPMFAVQLVGDWVERGWLQPSSQGFRLAPGVRIDMPGDLRQVWASRLDRFLSERLLGDTYALEIAAVLGQQVDATEWHAVCQLASVEPTDTLVDDLLENGLAVRSRDVHKGVWSFANSMLRETLEELARAEGRLRHWHRSAAGLLRGHGGVAAQGRLARHLQVAGELDEAAVAYLNAVDHAIRHADLLVALDHLRVRDKLLRDLDTPFDSRDWVEGYVRRAQVARHLGKPDEAGLFIEHALATAGQRWPDLVGAALRERGRRFIDLGDCRAALTNLQRAVGFAERSKDLHLLAITRLEQAQVLRRLGSLRWSSHTLETARKELQLAGGALDDLARTWLSEARNRIAAGELDHAAEAVEQARTLADKAGDRAGIAAALAVAGDLARHQGDMDMAEETYRKAYQLFSDLGRRNEAAMVRLDSILVQLVRGQATQAFIGLCDLRVIAEEWGRRVVLVGVSLAMAVCAARVGQWDEYEANLRWAFEQLSDGSIADPDFAWTAELAGEEAVRAGRIPAALKAFDVAASQYSTLGQVSRARVLQSRMQQLARA